MIERLLDHEQAEIVEQSQVILLTDGIGTVGIDGKQDVWVAAPHFSHRLNIPTRLDLELDPLITLCQVSINPIDKLIERGLDAEADTHWNARACSSDELRQRLAPCPCQQDHISEFQASISHVVSTKWSEP